LNNAVFLRDRIVLQLSGFGICGCGKFRVWLGYWIVRCSRSQRDLRRGCAAAHLLILGVPVLLGVGCLSGVNCCVLSGRGLCYGPITRPEESYRVCVCVCVCVCVFLRMIRCDSNPLHLHYLRRKRWRQGNKECYELQV
jgi:hypothetical protein